MTDALLTPRLILRRAQPGDLHDLHAVFSNPAAMRYWSRPEHERIEETQVWLDDMVSLPDTSDEFVIERAGRVIGKVGAWRLPEIGFILHPDHWRQGLASEALTVVVPWLFGRHAVDVLTAEADPRNAASLGLLQRLGFRETHRASRTLLWRDEWCDSVYLALPRAVWADRPS